MDADRAARSASFARATPLSQRLGPPDSIVGDESVGARRMSRWREREPFDDPQAWSDRLAVDDVDETLLCKLLGESADSLQRRTGPTSWVEELLDAPAQNAPDFDESGADGPYFAPVACDLLEPAVAGLEADLSELGAAAEDSAFDAAALTRQLQEALSWQIHAAFGRTMALELNLAREAGELTGDDSKARFAQFMNGFSDADRRLRLFAEYPVLARQISLRIRQWRENSLRIVQRILADAPELAQRFNDGNALGVLESVGVAAGDQHRNGQSVALVRWDTGLTLVYKPRSMQLDIAFGRLLDWLNESGMEHQLQSVRCLDRGDYGWSEFLVAEPCRDESGVRRFYHRQGALLALLGLLRANDMHAENLMAVGEHPVLIDLETLLRPKLTNVNTKQTPAEHLALEATATSVLHVGLLPSPAWVTKDGRSVDISGLGHQPGQRSSLTIPMLSDYGTDMMRVKMQRVDMETPDHRPVEKDTPVNLLDYADDLIEGYSRVHRLCRKLRDELLADDGPLEAFRGAQVRVLVQSTMIYSTLLRTGSHPDVLRDALDRDMMFDYLWRRVVQMTVPTQTIAAERRDLWRNDVPYFTAGVDGDRLFDSDGEPIPDLTVTPGLQLVRETLSQLDEDHLAGQLSLIKGALAAATMNSVTQFSYPEYPIPEAAEAASPQRLVEEAARLGDHLRSDAFDTGDSVQWLGLSSHMGRNWRLGPLSPDLFNGLTGVTLFFAELAKATGEGEYARIARHATATVRHQLDRVGTHTLHGMAGLPGNAYAFCRLIELLDDESLREDAYELVRRIRPEIPSDSEFDILSGSAGTIAALRSVHHAFPEGPAADVMRAAADHLLQAATPQERGLGWMPALIVDNKLASRPLSGFGHGTAGIAWALGEAAHILGDDRYADAARAAIEYERSLFNPEAENWADVRNAEDESMISAWCHGSVGIGLSRLGVRHTLYRDDPAEIDADVDAALADARDEAFGLSHSLCHGDAGAIDLFLTAANSLNQPKLRAEADRHTAAMMATIDDQGWVCGLPYGQSTPSMMVGLAGIGYQLLRSADPESVPSVSTLSIPSQRDRP